MYFPRGFDRRLAIELGELVLQAYAQHEAFEEGKPWSLSGGYRFLGAIACAPKRKDAPVPIGFVAAKRKAVYAIFRGTATSGEWMKNLSFNLEDYPLPGRGRAHSGFLEVYASLRESLTGSLAGRPGKARVYLAGHSLGGALATLAAPDLASNADLRVRAVYTFASPRAGDDDFVRAFNRDFEGRSFRVANTSDIVPSIPLPIPIGMGGYFSHVETPVDFTVQYESAEKNHEMATYLAALRDAKGRRNFFCRIVSRNAFRRERPAPIRSSSRLP